MSKSEWKKWIGVVGRLLLVYALVFAQGAWAAQNQATKDKAASPQKAAAQQANGKQSAAATTPVAQNKQAQSEESESAMAEEKPSRDGSHEGIKVHGHWTIEIRNPDGTVASHQEFENSLTPTGADVIQMCLIRGCAQPTWDILLATAPTPVASANLDISATVSQFTLGAHQVTLNGNATAPAALTIGFVGAQASNVLAPIATSYFSATTLTSPIIVAAQQTVQATVVLTFS